MNIEEDIVEKIKKLDDIYKYDLGINCKNNKLNNDKFNKFYLKDEFIIKKR